MGTFPTLYDSNTTSVTSSKPTSGPRRLGWRPFTLTRTVLVFATTFTVFLIILLGVLLWQDLTNGGVIIITPGKEFSDFQIFLFRYLPTVIVVFYGLFWGWLDLDIRRLEPYFQLARPGGVPAHDSLLLEYTNAFFAFVPFTSAKARHWVVFAVSILSLITNWAVIPLQNGIFASKIIQRNETVQTSQPWKLIPFAKQVDSLSASFLLDASSTLWLGQKLPMFTTSDFALAPVQVLVPTNEGVNRTLTVDTVLYQSDLTCHPPTNISVRPSSLIFDDGHGCIAEPSIPTVTHNGGFNFSSYYIGLNDDPRSGWSIESPFCLRNASNIHKLLIVWTRNNELLPSFDDSSNATALFCEPSYHFQAVQATVSIPDGNVQQVRPIGQRLPIPDDQFNQSHFEAITTIGALPFGKTSTRVGNTVLRQDTYVTNMSISPTVDTMTGLAIGTTHFRSEQYLIGTNMMDAYQSAHRIAFALAVRSIMEPPAEVSFSNAYTSVLYEAITTIPVLTISAQVALALVAASALFLLRQAPSRVSHLARDPDCIAENMLLSRDPAIRKYISAYSDWPQGSRSANDQRFTLAADDAVGYPALAMHGVTELDQPLASTIPPPNAEIGPYIEPTQYKWYVGVSFVALLAGMLAVLVGLKAKCEKGGGLRLPSSNEVVVQVLTNVLPTLIATSIEPVWVWLSRMMCVLAPLDNLERKPRPARESLLLYYAAITPQLAAWQAFRYGNYVLGAVSLVAFTAGVLTVVISGIFSTSDAKIFTEIKLPARFSGQLDLDVDNFISFAENQNDGSKALFAALPNVTRQAALPSWITPSHFFLPLNLDSLEGVADIVSINMQVPGYSVEPQCSELTNSAASDNTYDLRFNDNATVLSLATSHVSEDGKRFTCGVRDGDGRIPEGFQPDIEGLSTLQFIEGDPRGVQTLQQAAVASAISASNLRLQIPLEHSALCQQIMVFGWIRSHADFVSDGNVTEFGKLVSMNVSRAFMACRPRLTVKMFNISISPTGAVLEALPLGKASTELPSSVNFTAILRDTMRNYPNGGLATNLEWRNDTVPLTTSNVLQSRMTESFAFLDANQPPPKIADQIPIVSDLFTRIFVLTMRLSFTRFSPATATDPPVQAMVVTRQRRLFISPLSFNISVGILSIQLLVAIVFFATRPRPFLKRLPTSLAAQIAMFANSHVVDDAINSANGDFRELDNRGWTYGYGRFVGLDGKVDEGIERAPYVSSLDARPTGFQRSWQRLVRRRVSATQAQQLQATEELHKYPETMVNPTISTPLLR